MMDNSLGQQERGVGVLVRAYRRASSQGYEREMMTEVPQGEIVLGVMGERMQAQCLGVPGLEGLRVNPDYVRLLGQEKELRLFKGWLVRRGKQLPRRWQRQDRYSGQVNCNVRKGAHIITEGRGVDGVLFMAPGGVLVEVHFGNVEQLEARYGKKERVSTPSADKVAREKIQELKREEARWRW